MEHNSKSLIHKNNDKFIIELSPLLEGEHETKNIEFILDLDMYGNIIGVEIIDIKIHAGPNVLKECDSTHINFSYDNDSDVFYLKLSEGRSTDQMSIVGQLILNQNGSLIRLEGELPKKEK